MSRARVIVGSAEAMAEIRTSSVGLIVTSPPYWNAIDYDRYVANSDQDWKSRTYAKGFGSYPEYLGFMTRVMAEVFRVTEAGGFCVLVVGCILFKKQMIPLPADLTQRACSIGWLFHQEIVWHKTCSSSRRGAVLIRYPYPGRYYPNTVNESILVFKKPGHRKALANCRAKVHIDDLYKREIANSVWHIPTVPPRRVDHPCPFPEELVHRVVTLYSAPGDTVLDPFAGSGQTLKVAQALNRKAIGYELESGFAELAERRAAEPHARRPQRYVTYETIDPLATAPEPIANGSRGQP